MTLMVNGQKLDITLENEKTVGEVLKAFELEAEKAEAATVKICLNKKEISSEEFDSIINEPLTEETLIELSVITKNEVLEALSNSSETFTLLSKELEDIPVMLQSGKDAEAKHEEVQWTSIAFCGADCEQSEAKRRTKTPHIKDGV